MSVGNRSNYILATLLVAAVLGSWLLGRRQEVPAPPPASLPPGGLPARAASGEPGIEPTPAPPSPALLAAGEAVASQDWARARSILEAIPATDPDYSSALYNLGILHERTGNTKEAVAAFDALVHLHPDHPDGWVSLGWSLHRNGDPAAAEVAALRCLELQPENVTARYNVALHRLAQGRIEEAIRSYERAFQVDRQQTGLVAALSDLREFASVPTSPPESHYVLGFVFKAIGEPALEADALQKFLARAEDGPYVENSKRRLEALRAQASAPAQPAEASAAAAGPTGSLAPTRR